MSELFTEFVTLAQSDGQPAPMGGELTSADGANPAGGAAPAGGGGGGMMLMLPLLLLAVMFILMPLSTRKEKKRRAQMMNSLGRHDRVRTSGGIIGTIMELKGDEVVLKVDETTNTRITFDKGAVQGVIKHAKATGADEEEAPELDGEAEYATS